MVRVKTKEERERLEKDAQRRWEEATRRIRRDLLRVVLEPLEEE